MLKAILVIACRDDDDDDDDPEVSIGTSRTRVGELFVMDRSNTYTNPSSDEAANTVGLWGLKRTHEMGEIIEVVSPDYIKIDK